MSNTSYEKEKEKAHLIQELSKVVKQQISGEMDYIRSKAYWATRLPQIEPALLAEALPFALDRALLRALSKAMNIQL